MREISVNQFRSSLKTFVDNVVSQHEPLVVTRKRGSDFVVIGADDWEQIQETLYVLQNKELMSQINSSLNTHDDKKGYQPTSEELNEIISI